MNEILSTVLFPAVSSFLTGFVTFFFTRRKYVSEVKANDIKNMQESLQFYIKMVEDNKKRIDDYQAEISEVRRENVELRRENSELRRQMQELSLQLIGKQIIK